MHRLQYPKFDSWWWLRWLLMLACGTILYNAIHSTTFFGYARCVHSRPFNFFIFLLIVKHRLLFVSSHFWACGRRCCGCFLQSYIEMLMSADWRASIIEVGWFSKHRQLGLISRVGLWWENLMTRATLKALRKSKRASKMLWRSES